MAATKSEVVFTPAAPSPVTAAVMGRSFVPTLDTVLPTFSSLPPTSLIMARVALEFSASWASLCNEYSVRNFI